MKKNSMMVLTSVAVVLGLLGSFATGCGVSVNPLLQPVSDSIGDRNPPLTEIVPLGKGNMELERSSP